MGKLRFRMWDGKEMLYKLADNWTFGEDGNKLSPIQDYLVLMQYTGLKDKNDKEIFESDIVSTGFDFIKTVIFYHGEHQTAVKLVSSTGNQTDIGSCDSARMEVVGNIHQNKELLEGK